MLRPRPVQIGVGGLAMCLSVATRASATPVDSLGVGARSKAMAGATAADPRDYSVNYYNPSGLVKFDGLELGVGYTHAGFSLEANGEPSDIRAVDAWMFGVVAPGKIASIPFAFGMAGQLPQGYLSRAQTIRESDAYWVFYESRMQLLYTSFNLAVMPLSGWSLAVGTASLATTRGGFQVRGTTVAAEFGRSEYESELTHQVDANLVSTRYPQYSSSFDFGSGFKVAASYREQAKLDTDVSASLDTVIDGTVLEIPVRYDVVVRSVKTFIPRQLNLAGAWTPSRWTFEVDLTWYDWSGYRSPIGTTSSHFEADPPEGVTIELPEAPNTPPPPNPGFRDRIVPRFGVEYRLSLASHWGLPLRAGYVYEATPVPAQTGTTAFLDATRHVVSGGVGVVDSGLGPWLGRGLCLDLAVQWGILEKRTQTRMSGDTLSADGSFWATSADVSLEF